MSYEIGTHIDLTGMNTEPAPMVVDQKTRDYDIIFKTVGNKLTSVRPIPVVFA